MSTNFGTDERSGEHLHVIHRSSRSSTDIQPSHTIHSNTTKRIERQRRFTLPPHPSSRPAQPTLSPSGITSTRIVTRLQHYPTLEASQHIPSPQLRQSHVLSSHLTKPHTNAQLAQDPKPSPSHPQHQCRHTWSTKTHRGPKTQAMHILLPSPRTRVVRMA